MKIAVYTIALNEEEFAERWANSAKDADHLLVLDTGSTDRTAEVLTNLGVTVHHAVIKPWRFDDARNIALHLLPADIDVCVQLDMDEVLTPNWRQAVEKAWTPETNKLNYQYVWSLTEHGEPEISFSAGNIVGRHTHRWKHPVHEFLAPTVPEVTAGCQDVLIEHHPNPNKSRGYYLDLLELAVQEDPTSDRNMHYLGREYYFRKQYDNAIAYFQRHIQLPTARWPAERAASLRYGGQCYEALGNIPAAYNWYMLAILEDTQSREALIDLAGFLLRQQDWLGVVYFAHRALQIKESNYKNERYALKEGAYDLSAVALYNLGDKQAALSCAKKAVELNPYDERLRQNLILIGGDDQVP